MLKYLINTLFWRQIIHYECKVYILFLEKNFHLWMIDVQYNVKALNPVRQNHSHMCFKMVKFLFTKHEQENEKNKNTTLSVQV